MAKPSEITMLLAEMGEGKSEALPKLIPLVYQELKRLLSRGFRPAMPRVFLNICASATWLTNEWLSSCRC